MKVFAFHCISTFSKFILATLPELRIYKSILITSNVSESMLEMNHGSTHFKLWKLDSV